MSDTATNSTSAPADWTPSDALLDNLLGLLEETWHGHPPADWPAGWSYYSNLGEGFDQTCAGLSGAQALQPVGRTSIAQHVAHSAFGARIFAAWLRGEAPAADWPGSFNIDASGGADETWAALKADLDVALVELRSAIEQHAAQSQRRSRQASGAVAHLIYHLGALRSKLTALA